MDPTYIKNTLEQKQFMFDPSEVLMFDSTEQLRSSQSDGNFDHIDFIMNNY